MQNAKEKNLPTQTNQSSDKMLHLLELLADIGEPVRLQDIARVSGMNASTVLRFLTALGRRDYVSQDQDTGRYFLTFKLCALAGKISASNSIRNISRPFLRSVSQIFSESANLAIESNMSVMYIEVIGSQNRALTTTQYIGNIAPMHSTGVGKLLLCNYSKAQIDQFAAIKGLARLTENTITSISELIEELKDISARGYAFDNEECEMGMRCVAAPIRDYTGAIVAGISVSGPVTRMSDAHIFTHLPFLLDTAEQISIRMGWKA